MILQFLSNLLHLEIDEINKFITSSPHRYKVYKIPKRKKSEYRIIAQPSSQLKFIQKAVIKEFFSDLPIHSCAMAYVKGKGIKDNALLHVNNNYLLKMDFKDFFPSIGPGDFLNHLKNYSSLNLSDKDKIFIKNIFFWAQIRGKPLVMSIGAPSSPFISNTIMYTFDKIIEEYCKKNDITYTRYADDLVFSTSLPKVLFLIPDFIEKTIKSLSYPRLKINFEKTVFSSKKHNRHITGLTITNESKISIGRAKKRYISSLVHKHTLAQIDCVQLSFLKGYLAFCLDVEKQFIKQLEKKYGDLVIRELLNQ